MKSPFLYAGGKYYARKYIDKHLRSSEVYCEPYAGGGSIFFHKDKSNKTILNDLDNELINTYRIIRDYPAELIKQLDCFELPSKEFYDYLKYEYKPSNEIEEASRWYYLNSEYSSAAKPPVRCGGSHLSGLTEPLVLHCHAWV